MNRVIGYRSTGEAAYMQTLIEKDTDVQANIYRDRRWYDQAIRFLVAGMLLTSRGTALASA